MVDGVAPPHDDDAEAAVLSSCMLAEQSALDEVSDFLLPDHFYREAHRQIMTAILACARLGRPIDVVTVGGWLKDENRLAQVGGMGFLASVLEAAPAVKNVRAYAEKIHAHWKLRRAIATCQMYAARGYHERHDPNALLEELERDIFALAGVGARDRTINVHSLLREVYDRIKSAYNDGRPPGIPTGFQGYDDRTVGLHRQDVTLVAARPGAGKTALLLAWALNIAGAEPMLLSDDGTPWQPNGVAFFTLEMPRQQIGQRLIAIESRVSAHRMRTGRIEDGDWSPMVQACTHIARLPIEIDDTSALSIVAARAKVRRIKASMAKRGVRLAVAFFDYLQLMKGSVRAHRRIEEIGEISRGLKQLAKDEEIAVVAGCQLNRALEARTGAEKKPRIADLRESGDLEQDADNIVFIHRPEMYGEKMPDGEEGKTELIIAKQRNGPVGSAYARYIGGCTRFEDFPEY